MKVLALPLVAAIAASADPPASIDSEEALDVHGETSIEVATGQLVLRFDLPEGDDYHVRLMVDLGGRMPHTVQAVTVEGDVGDAVPGGPGRTVTWSAFEDRRRLTGRETAWVKAVPGAMILPVLRDGPLEMQFAYVPGGTFWIGSPRDESFRKGHEGPQVQRELSSFELLNTEVTQLHFEAVMGYNDSRVKHADRPVERVTWFEALTFCEKLEELDPEHEYRLPTEAEWEYACRAGTTSPYYWEEVKYTSAPKADAAMYGLGWHGGNSGGKSRRVAQHDANAWGLHDMHGNVWEWCADEWSDRHPPTAPPVATSATPTPRVVRGGSWRSPSHECRSASRRARNPDERGKDLGFRVLRVRRD